MPYRMIILLATYLLLHFVASALVLDAKNGLEASFDDITANNVTTSHLNGKSVDELIALIQQYGESTFRSSVMSTTTTFLGSLPATWTSVMSLTVPMTVYSKVIVRAEICAVITGANLMQCRFNDDLHHRIVGRPKADGLICLPMTTFLEGSSDIIVDINCQAAAGVTFVGEYLGKTIVNTLSTATIRGGFDSTVAVGITETVTSNAPQTNSAVFSAVPNWNTSITASEPSIALSIMDISTQVSGSNWFNPVTTLTGDTRTVHGSHWQFAVNYAISPVRVSEVSPGPVSTTLQQGQGVGTIVVRNGQINLAAIPRTKINDYDYSDRVVDISFASEFLIESKTFALNKQSAVLLFASFGVNPTAPLFTVNFYANNHLIGTKVVGSCGVSGSDSGLHPSWFATLPPGLYTFSASIQGSGTTYDASSYGIIWDNHLNTIVLN